MEAVSEALSAALPTSSATEGMAEAMSLADKAGLRGLFQTDLSISDVIFRQEHCFCFRKDIQYHQIKGFIPSTIELD